MTWNRSEVSAALADMFAAADPLVNAFALPPETFNPPALVCTDPAVVTKRTAGMGVDQTEFVVIAAVGLGQADDLDGLCDLADKAILADPTLTGVARAAMVTEVRNFRPLKVGGADFRAADLAIRIDM